MIYFDGALTKEEWGRRRRKREPTSALRQGHDNMTPQTRRWVESLQALLEERGSMDAYKAREELGVPVTKWEQVKRAAAYEFLFHEDESEIGVL